MRRTSRSYPHRMNYSLWGSSPRPMAHKTIALTTELMAHVLMRAHARGHVKFVRAQHSVCAARLWAADLTTRPQALIVLAGYCLNAYGKFAALYLIICSQIWTHWDLNPGPSACEADVIPLHHVPSCVDSVFFVLVVGVNSCSRTI